MAKATVSSKGQLVIPVELRRRLGIEAGCELDLTEEGSSIRLTVSRSRPAANGGRQRRPGRHARPVGVGGYCGGGRTQRTRWGTPLFSGSIRQVSKRTTQALPSSDCHAWSVQ